MKKNGNNVNKSTKVGKAKLTIALMLVFVLAISAGLMVLLQTNTSSRGVVNEIQNSEFVAQRTAVEGFNQSSDELNVLLDDIQNSADTRSNDDIYLSELLEKANVVINNLNNIFELVQNSTELSPEIIAFMDELQAQSDALGAEGSSAGIQSRKNSYNSDFLYTIPVLWWTITTGAHISPTTSGDLAVLAGSGVATAEYIAKKFKAIAPVAGVIAVILFVQAALLEVGSNHYGCDITLAVPVFVPCLWW